MDPEHTLPPVIVAFVGHDGSGKDTAAAYMEATLANYGVRAFRFAFADKMKREAADALAAAGNPSPELRAEREQDFFEQLNGERRNDPMVRNFWASWSYWRRKLVSENVYTGALESMALRHRTTGHPGNWKLVTDTRRLGEIELIKTLGDFVFVRTVQPRKMENNDVQDSYRVAGMESAIRAFPFRWLGAAVDATAYSTGAAALNLGIPFNRMLEVNTSQAPAALIPQVAKLIPEIARIVGTCTIYENG